MRASTTVGLTVNLISVDVATLTLNPDPSPSPNPYPDPNPNPSPSPNPNPNPYHDQVDVETIASLFTYFQNLLWSAWFQIAVSMVMLYRLLGVRVRVRVTVTVTVIERTDPDPLRFSHKDAKG